MDNDIHNPKQNHAFCGGAILNENWILSAGHCCKGKYEDEIHAMVGAHFDHTCHHRGVCDNNNPKRKNIIGQKIPIEKIKIHPSYEKRQYIIYNDFCLLKVMARNSTDLSDSPCEAYCMLYTLSSNSSFK